MPGNSCKDFVNRIFTAGAITKLNFWEVTFNNVTFIYEINLNTVYKILFRYKIGLLLLF